MTALEALYPLTPVQQGMLLQCLRWPGSGLYIMQSCVTLRGDLDAECLKAAWNVLVKRHGALRSAFVWRGLEQPLQAVVPEATLALDVVDWSHLDDAGLGRARSGFLDRDRRTGFDLRIAPVGRLTLARLAGSRHYLFWSCHHLIMDGWSQGILLAELSVVYRQLSTGQPLQLPKAPQFADYAHHLRSRSAEAASAFWKRHLCGFAGPTSFGVDCNVARETGEMRHVRQRFPRELALRLDAFCRSERLTLTAVLLGAWGRLLQYHSGEPDVVVGLTVSGRSVPLPGVQHMVGALLNALPLRVPASRGIAVRDWLGQVQRATLDVQQYADSSPHDIRRWVGVEPSTPLFESLFVLENAPLALDAFGAGSDLSIESVESFDDNADALTLTILPDRDGVALDISHAEGRFPAGTIQRLLNQYENFVAALLEESATGIWPLDPAREGPALAKLEASGPAPAPELGLMGLLQRVLQRAPHGVAVVDGSGSLTYAGLAARVAALAARLRRAGVTPDAVVPILAQRGTEAVVAMMAVAAAGAAWLPLDPALPLARIVAVCRSVSARIAIVETPTPELGLAVPECIWATSAEPVAKAALSDEALSDEALSDAALSDAPGNAPAYLIPTSGSTGQPKLVVVEHASLRYVTACWRTAYSLTNGPEHILQIGNFGADVFIGDWLKALMTGGSLIICPNASRSEPREIYRLLVEHGVTLFESVPGLIVPFFEYLHRKGLTLPRLRRVILGSDTLRMTELERLTAIAPHVSFINGYGLTEATIETTTYERVPGVLSRSGLAPLGRPFPGTRCLILDDQLRRRPVGSVGELYLAGPGLAHGYFGDDEGTRARFVVAPWGERLLRTGDLARWHEGGFLEFFGRSDSLVKIRGFRVELGEIENALCGTPGVQAAVAFVDGSVLYACVELEPWTTVAEVEGALRTRLPDYMMPAIRALSHLPRNDNGKLDRGALRRQSRAAPVAHTDPTTPTEERLLAIWAELLEKPHVKPTDSFIGVGGTSLKVIQLANAIHTHFGVDLEVADLFACPTLAALAKKIDASATATEGANGK